MFFRHFRLATIALRTLPKKKTQKVNSTIGIPRAPASSSLLTPSFNVIVSRLAFSVIAFGILAAPARANDDAASADRKAKPVFESKQLIVLYRDSGTSDAASGEEIIAAVREPLQSARALALSARFGSPKAARHLIQARHSFPPEVLTRAKTGEADIEPPEVLLQKYVVLSFDSVEDRRAAEERLRKDVSVRWVGQNEMVRMSVYPADPLVFNSAAWPNGALPEYRQWALQAMNVFPAWDHVRGHAYIGVVDNGIQTMQYGSASIHPDLQSNFRNQFAYGAGVGYQPSDLSRVNDQFGPRTDVRGHGTAVAGIIAASVSNPTNGVPPNGSNIGVAGVCWYCNLLVIKNSAAEVVNLVLAPDTYEIPSAIIIDGIYWAVNAGAQVLNLSFGNRFLQTSPPTTDCHPDEVVETNPYCVALAFSRVRDVVIVAAAGNDNIDVQFPARDPRVIPVVATQADGNLWDASAGFGDFRSNHGPAVTARGLAAPGKDVLTTVVQLHDYALNCGDSYPYWNNPIERPPIGIGYGTCTGTSFAAPHVTGIVALMRSINPLLHRDYVSSRLRSASNRSGNPDEYFGAGIPNAVSAVNSTLATTNRLTPLFAFYSTGATDYFYSTAPQMGSAAIAGTLPVLRSGNTYSPVGNMVRIPDWSDQPLPWTFVYYLPGTNQEARAQAWVFSTHRNPFNPSVELAPLMRLSFSCANGYSPSTKSICVTTGNYHADHFYTTDWNEVLAFRSNNGYQYDGIEGYVYPLPLTPQPGMELLLRGYHPGRDDYAIFPQSDQAAMLSQGYTAGLTSLGYVYRNATTYRPVY